MKRTYIKRWLCILLSAMLILGLSACGKKEVASGNDGDGSLGETSSTQAPVATVTDESGNVVTDPSGNVVTEPITETTGTGGASGSKTDKQPGGGKTSGATTKKPTTKTTRRDKDLKGREIRIVAWWDPTSTNSEGYKQMKQVESRLNCKLVERKMTDYKPLYTSILAGNPLADIFCPRDTDILNLANKGYLTPLSDLSNFDFDAEKWNQAMRKESMLNGKVYGMGTGYQFREMLLYNKDMFKKNGWDDLYTLQSQGKLTWSKLEEITNKAVVLDSAKNVMRYGLVPTYDIGEFAFSMIHANGVNAVTHTPNTKTFKYTLNSTAARTALSTLQKWVSNKGAIYDSSNFGWDTGRSVFSSQKAAMALADYDMWGTIAANADFTIGAVLFPHGPNSKQDLVTLIPTFTAIPAGVKNPNDVALVWDIRTELGWKGLEDVLTSDTIPDQSFRVAKQRYIDAMNSGNYFHDYGKKMGSADIKATFKKIAYKEITPEAGIQSIGQKINAAISDFWK